MNRSKKRAIMTCILYGLLSVLSFILQNWFFGFLFLILLWFKILFIKTNRIAPSGLDQTIYTAELIKREYFDDEDSDEDFEIDSDKHGKKRKKETLEKKIRKENKKKLYSKHLQNLASIEEEFYVPDDDEDEE